MADKILIIDDDVDTLKLVGLMLERQGYDITVASNGSQGIRKASTDQPNLILLDVMMPDMDGYEVTQKLRSDPSLAHIPIIMFTAKSMVDDKVAGFEAGVDDYLTKPTHPAELTAHVKAVLARAVTTTPEPSGGDKAHVIAFLGARGGMGTSTLALNIALALQASGQDVIFAEMNPGRSTSSLDLGIDESKGLSTLLGRSLKDIHLRSVEAELLSHRSGLRLLLGDSQPASTEFEQAIPQMEAIVSNLGAMATAVILDLGSGLRPYVKPLLEFSDRLVLVVEPVYPSTQMGLALAGELEASGYARHKMHLALLTRMRTSLQIPWRQLQTDFGLELAGIISPAPEQAHQASQAGTPLVLMEPNSLVADQIRKMAEQVARFMQPIGG